MPRKLVGDLQPGDKILTMNNDVLEIENAFHNPILETKGGRAWVIQTTCGVSQIANSLDQIEVPA